VIYAYIDPRIRVVLKTHRRSLERAGLSVSFATRQGVVRAVDGLLRRRNEGVLGIVGESGSGKSVAMYSMLGLVRDANVSISAACASRAARSSGSRYRMQSVAAARSA